MFLPPPAPSNVRPSHPRPANGARGHGAAPSSGAAKMSLALRGQVDFFDSGLSGVPGAQKVIKSIQERKTVTKLALGHNDLGDEGCAVLFAYLRSEDGRRRDRITEVSLNGNGIGEAGLLAIAAWLEGHERCLDLFLQDNDFHLSSTSVITLASAVASSHLHGLSLNSMPSLGDAFVHTFLAHLSAPHLRELGLSDTGLTPRASKAIAAYMRARPRCRLHALRLNANLLGPDGARRVVRALRRNWSLARVEMGANGLAGAPSVLAEDVSSALQEKEEEEGSSSSDEDGPMEAPHPPRTGPGRSREWKDLERDVRMLTERNGMMRRKVEREALALLRYARPVLLRSRQQQQQQQQQEAEEEASAASEDPTRPPPLPTELVHAILFTFAPTLSPKQRRRVLDYALTPSTLPSGALSLPTRDGGEQCVPDPAAAGPVWSFSGPPAARRHDACAAGCIGGIKCRREEERAKWLARVACDVYDPYDEL